MPSPIELERIPRQSFEIVVEQSLYEIRIITDDEESLVSISRDSEVLISNVRAIPNKPIIQSEYLFSEFGNFIFTSDDNETYPFYENFGITTVFQYLSIAEANA